VSAAPNAAILMISVSLHAPGVGGLKAIKPTRSAMTSSGEGLSLQGEVPCCA